MRCEEVQDLVEALAEGDVGPSAEVDAHLRTCVHCSASLSRARQIDRRLQALPVPVPPPTFTAAVVRRTRSIRWESEQRFDWWFNTAMAIALTIIGVGVWGVMHVTGLTAVTVGTADFLGRSLPALYDRVKPELGLYLTASALVIGALGVWWWLERAGEPRQTA
jgi:predicted anti-sigma-YlaC factor YlaD